MFDILVSNWAIPAQDLESAALSLRGNVPTELCKITLSLSDFDKRQRTNERTPWNRVLREKLMCPQLAKKFPTFYGTRWFITPFTRALDLSLSLD
jgi:hypothetical protein